LRPVLTDCDRLMANAPEIANEPRPTPRPTLEGLFDFPLREENDGAPADAPDQSSPFYEGWHADHLGRPRFYIRGSRRARVHLQTLDAKRYYGGANKAIELIKAKTDWAQYGGDWTSPAYNQFTRAFKNKPVTLEKAAIVIASMESIFSEDLSAGKFNGHTFDLYGLVSIVPACYNIDDFTEEKLDQIRQKPNGITCLLRACSQ
jgi:hypothetical protein